MHLFGRIKWYFIIKKKAATVTILLLTLALFGTLQTQDGTQTFETNAQTLQTDLPTSYMTVVHEQHSNKRIPEVGSNRFSGIARGDVSWLNTPEDFFRRLEEEEGQTQCKRMTRIGGESCRHVLDGHKYVCLDPDLNMQSRPCVVYSFGVSDDISFDTKVNEYGCHVYLMDPTLPPGSYNWLTGNMKFFPYGLAHINKTYPMNLTGYLDWEGTVNATVLPFDEVRKVIGHTGTVHYLKMDVEGSEWYALRHIMDNNLLQDVLQIGIEIHLSGFTDLSNEDARNAFRERWLFLEELEDHGFLRARYDPTRSIEGRYQIPGTNRTVQICGELLLLRRTKVTSRPSH